MKIIKTASGKQQIKISKSEWENIGKKAGWGLEEDIYDDNNDTPKKECEECHKLFPENKLDKGCCKSCWGERKGDHLRDVEKDER